MIAQKVGIPATLAAIYIGFLARLKQRGELDACGDINVTLRGGEARIPRRDDRAGSRLRIRFRTVPSCARRTWSFACSSWL